LQEEIDALVNASVACVVGIAQDGLAGPEGDCIWIGNVRGMGSSGGNFFIKFANVVARNIFFASSTVVLEEEWNYSIATWIVLVPSSCTIYIWLSHPPPKYGHVI
jgi:hypothetical protein